MFWMRNKENNFQIHTLIYRPVNLLNNLEIIHVQLSDEATDPDLNELFVCFAIPVLL